MGGKGKGLTSLAFKWELPMARNYGNWTGFARGLVSTLQSEEAVTMTIEQIKEGTKTTMTLESLQDRGYWNACREGKKYFETQTNAGLTLQEHLDERGKVLAVTYRLARPNIGTLTGREKADCQTVSIPQHTTEVNSNSIGRESGPVAHRQAGATTLMNGHNVLGTSNVITPEPGRSFQGFFQTADVQRDNFMARVFGLFSEEPVRIWCRDPDSPFEDLGRPKLGVPGVEDRGYVLDFALRSRRDGRVFVAEMKCEITFENYRSMTLRSRTQLDRHAKEKEAFRRFLAIARDPASHRVTVNGQQVTVSGAILVWGACTPEGRRDVAESTGIADVLSLEEVIATLIRKRNAEYASFVQKQRRRCEELFDFLSRTSVD